MLLEKIWFSLFELRNFNNPQILVTTLLKQIKRSTYNCKYESNKACCCG